MLAIIDGDVLLYQALWGSDNLREAKDKFGDIVVDVLENTFATDYTMAFGGPSNFRDDLYADYKKSPSRVKSKSTRPEWFDDLKSFALSYEGAVICDGYEADDQVRIWAEECRQFNYYVPHIICSVDKDLDCISGAHYNPRTKAVYHISPDQADQNYWLQCLTGDTVDNIPGIKGIGPVKAGKILEDCYNRFERKQEVCIAYFNHFGEEEGYNNLLMNGKLLHIWRTYNDHFTLDRSFYDNAIGA